MTIEENQGSLMLKTLTTKALFAAGAATVTLSAVSAPAEAAIFTVNGEQWDITTVETSFNDFFANAGVTPESQPWWSSRSVAEEFASTVGNQLGFPNPSSSAPFIIRSGPYFAFNRPGRIFPGFSTYSLVTQSTVSLPLALTGRTFTYAVASRVPPQEIPTPALLPGLVGMGIAALRKRKGEAEEAEA